MPQPSATTTRPMLSVWDTASIIVGIVVGTAIFKLPSSVFENSPSVAAALGLWVLGGLISFIGALCYAELATTYPRSGGDYEYLTRAFGRWTGFQFGWFQLTVVITGSIGSMAYAFADYAVVFLGMSSGSIVWLAAASVVLLSVVNIGGLIFGKVTQNILTVVKVLGFGAIIVCGVMYGDTEPLTQAAPMKGPGIGLALVFVLYTYGGWNHAAFVTAEVSHQKRDIPRAMVLGIVAITVIYVAVNAGCVAVLGFEGARNSTVPATDVLQAAMGPTGGKLAGILVMLSALGAINGMILTGARVYAVLGEDYPVLAALGHWSEGNRAPVAALIAQAVIVLLMIFGVGTPQGQGLIDQMLVFFGASPAPWDNYSGGFNTLIAASAPAFWLFFILTALSLFVLRWKDSDRERPFRVPLYPVTPALFCLASVFMLHSSVSYAKSLTWLAVLPLVTGTLLFLVSVKGKPENDCCSE